MTEYQERQIRGFRMRGEGYKAIASATGLSRDIVRNYCKSHGLEEVLRYQVLRPLDGSFLVCASHLDS